MKTLKAALVFIMAVFAVFAAASAFAAEMSYDNGTFTVSGLDGEAKLIQVSYTDGCLSRVKIYDVENGETNVDAVAGDKLFLWDGLDTMRPVAFTLSVPAPENTEKNILIAYFSRAGENWQVGYVEKGNTAVIAEYISDSVDADVFEIAPTVPYPKDYYETIPIAQRERQNNERPEFLGEIGNIDKYDTVFLGYPIWNGGLPMIMYTFLEQYDLSGKTVIPFSTHGGSGWGSTLSELRSLCPGAEFIDGFSTPGTNARNARNDVVRWLEGIELPIES